MGIEPITPFRDRLKRPSMPTNSTLWSIMLWLGEQDSNLHRSESESDALPIIRSPKILAERAGFEPAGPFQGRSLSRRVR